MASDPYARVVIGGTLYGSQGWSIGVSFALGSPPTNTKLYQWLLLLAPHVHTWAFAMTGGTPTWGTLTKCNSLATYGYAAGSVTATAQAQAPLEEVAGSASATLPPQCAVVHSLLSGAPGRKNRGRVYVPLTAGGAIGNGQLPATKCQELASDMATLLTSMSAEDYDGSPTTPSIATTRPVPTIPIGAVAVDSVVDTQRRRTDKIVPVYAGSAVPL